VPGKHDDIIDFPGDIIRLHEKLGFRYHARFAIWKEPLRVAIRTRSKSLTHRQLCADSSLSSNAGADYLLVFRKAGENKVPITHGSGLSKYVGEREVPADLAAKYRNWKDPKTNKLGHWIWQQYASSFWDDIRVGRVLPYKQARDKEFQAVLPLKGKPKNTWQDSPDTLYANKEIEAIALAIGVDHHKRGDTPDLSGLRYRKIIVMADADVDGSHIQVLLLTLFFRHFPKLIENGHVYVAQPPLFRVDVPPQGKNKPARKLYALDRQELASLEEKLADEGVKEGMWTVSRFKGLGEMSPGQLWETTLNPDTRRMLPVLVADGELDASNDIFNMMMARENASQRREWMETYGNLVDADIS
jgi:hypothetical protein